MLLSAGQPCKMLYIARGRTESPRVASRILDAVIDARSGTRSLDHDHLRYSIHPALSRPFVVIEAMHWLCHDSCKLDIQWT